MVGDPRRGEVYWANLEPVVGSEQGGHRPVLVVQNDVGNRHAPMTIVVPLTRRSPRKHYPFMVRATGIASEDVSWIHCGHVRSVDKSRLAGEPLAMLGQATMRQVDDALRASLGLY